MGKKLPRGIRNHNAGNIDYNGTRWQGLDDPPSDGRFCRFKAPEWGIRAMCKVLRTYQTAHGLNTIRGIINRWAPPHENDTGAYVNAVAKAVGVKPDQEIDVTDPETLLPLLKAIITHENGMQPYDDKTLKRGMELAGVVAPPEKKGFWAWLMRLFRR